MSLDLTIAIAAIVGAAAGGTMGLLMSWAAGLYDRRPYSSAAFAFRITPYDQGYQPRPHGGTPNPPPEVP